MVLYSVNSDFLHNLCSFFGLGVLTQNFWVLVKTKLRKVTVIQMVWFLYAKDIFEYNLWRVNRNQCWYTDIRYTLTLIIVNASLRRDCMSNSKHAHIFVFVSLRIFDYEEEINKANSNKIEFDGGTFSLFEFLFMVSFVTSIITICLALLSAQIELVNMWNACP